VERNLTARLDFPVYDHVAHAVVQKVAFRFETAEGVLKLVGQDDFKRGCGDTVWGVSNRMYCEVGKESVG
jgi:hypothetical protein